MPAKKTARTQERRRIANRQVRSSTRTAVKKAVRSIAAHTEDAATDTHAATAALDRAVTKGVVHRNAAARSKSRLMKRLNAASS